MGRQLIFSANPQRNFGQQLTNICYHNVGKISFARSFLLHLFITYRVSAAFLLHAHLAYAMSTMSTLFSFRFGRAISVQV
jgi:hypothetical protein